MKNGKRLLSIFWLVLCVAPARAADNGIDELRSEIAYQERQRQAFRQLLGESRWQRLRAARFDYELYEHEMGPRLDDMPHKREEVADSMLHCAAKLWRESLEQRLRLEERRDRARHKMRGKRKGGEGAKARGLDISPRVRVGERSSLGFKLQLRDARSPLLSGLAFRLAHDVGGSDLNLKFTYQSARADAFFVVHTEHRQLGRAAAAGIRFSL